MLAAPRVASNPDINVTPLVDVMLVLLIIMMLVAPLLQQGVQLTLPTAANTTDKPDTSDQTSSSSTPTAALRQHDRGPRGSVVAECEAVFEEKEREGGLPEG